MRLAPALLPLALASCMITDQLAGTDDAPGAAAATRKERLCEADNGVVRALEAFIRIRNKADDDDLETQIASDATAFVEEKGALVKGRALVVDLLSSHFAVTSLGEVYPMEPHPYSVAGVRTKLLGDVVLVTYVLSREGLEGQSLVKHFFKWVGDRWLTFHCHQARRG